MTVRSRILQAIRRFFTEHGYIEVETPVRIATPALENHIDAEPAGDRFLRTSPELHMKRLLVEGFPRIFQIGPCFRRGEQGRFHTPEYTMLEWYRQGADYESVLTETRALMRAVATEARGATRVTLAGAEVDLAGPWSVWTVAEAFGRWAGWDPVRDWDADRFDWDLVHKVEPALPRTAPVALKDYPVAAAALARCRGGAAPVAERWELYLGGLELANAFSELTDPREQRRRFEVSARTRARAGREVYALDEDFLAALSRGLPACAGVALGVDRLALALTDGGSLNEVRAF